jgi:hypothetical protein
MSKTIKIKEKRKKKTKTRKQNKRGKGLTEIMKLLPNNTPKAIDEISQQINMELINKNNKTKKNNKEQIMESFIINSYSPSINKELVSLKSMKRETLSNCNTKNAFLLKEPIKIKVANNCYFYYEAQAKQFLLKNLAANKHVNPAKIITPVQSLGNCWFNTMFVCLFISDKGRKFFHFFRQLMIEGQQADGQSVPDKLRNGFALLNYAIDACLTGNDFAYTIDTNAIINEIYEAIPNSYKEKLSYITPIREAGNPIRYYGSLIYYLNNKSLNLLFVSAATREWKTMITDNIRKKQIDNPHLIVLEFFDDESNNVTNKPTHFTVNNKKYMLDSCIIRDTGRQHFSSLLTCERKEMAYDGMSFHRLVNMDWKKNINTNYSWRFEGSKNASGSPLEWNFLNGYQMLIYYRVK